jgi:ribosome-associated toxin RatA of RatAB toxin-antitoxin module
MKRLILALLMVCAAPAMAQVTKPDPPKLDVSVRRVEQDGMHLYEVDSTGVVSASPAAVWKILTAYERMDEFVPDMESSRVLSRNGNETIIEQFGTAHFLFVTRGIHLVVRATETPMSAIDIALISGDMKHYEAHWELVPIPETGGTRIVYSGKMVPDFYVPGFLGAKLIRNDIERMMSAVLVRLERKGSVEIVMPAATAAARKPAQAPQLPAPLSQAR